MTAEEQQQAINAIRLALEARPIQILIVEDETKDAELTIDSLKKFGLKCQWARNLKEVLSIMRTENPWLVFLDLQLDTQSGLSVLSAIRAFKPETRIVVLTGAYQHDSQQCKEALRMGAIAVMLKPLTEAQIHLIFGTP